MCEVNEGGNIEFGSLVEFLRLEVESELSPCALIPYGRDAVKL